MYKKIEIESKVTSLRIVEKAIDEATSEMGISPDNYGKILISTLEGVNNAILHGNLSDPEKKVEIEISTGNGELKIKITDQNWIYSENNSRSDSPGKS